MIRLLVPALFLLTMATPPSAERALIRLLKTPDVQQHLAGSSELIVYNTVCNYLNCKRLPVKIKGKPLLIASKEDLFMRAGPPHLEVDSIYQEGKKMHIFYRLTRFGRGGDRGAPKQFTW